MCLQSATFVCTVLKARVASLLWGHANLSVSDQNFLIFSPPSSRPHAWSLAKRFPHELPVVSVGRFFHPGHRHRCHHRRLRVHMAWTACLEVACLLLPPSATRHRGSPLAKVIGKCPGQKLLGEVLEKRFDNTCQGCKD